MLQIRSLLSLAVLGFALTPEAARAEDDLPDYGLGRLMSHSRLGAASTTVAVTRINLAGEQAYVADFYGDGLIQFRVGSTLVESALADQVSASVPMDLRSISEVVGAAGLGAIAGATSFRKENNALVLEHPAAAVAGTASITISGTVAYAAGHLAGFKHTWLQPTRPPNRRSRAKLQTAARDLANVLNALPPPPGPPPGPPPPGPSMPPPGVPVIVFPAAFGAPVGPPPSH